MIEIDGSQGEGGGQVLRSSLALSMITSQPVRIYRIRAGRSRPGLQRQHLSAVLAASKICDASISGATIGSSELIFQPSKIRPGDYYFPIGTAGSCALVLQTVLPALMLASASSRVVVEGGTHNPHAPPFEFLKECFLPQIRKLGMQVSLHMERAGFYPVGGGRMVADIAPPKYSSEPIDLIHRGKLLDREGAAIVSQLPERIATRELETANRILEWPKRSWKVVQADSPGPGNALCLKAVFENVTEIVTGFGEKGVPAEIVAKRAALEMQKYLSSQAPVGLHLADQLLLPLALTNGGTFCCVQVTDHTTTNIETIKRFLDVDVIVETQDDQSAIVRMLTRNQAAVLADSKKAMEEETE